MEFLRRSLVGLVVGCSFVGLSACGGSSNEAAPKSSVSHYPSPSKPESFPVHGSIAVDGGFSANGLKGETCFTPDGYDDIAEGVQVVVADSSGSGA